MAWSAKARAASAAKRKKKKSYADNMHGSATGLTSMYRYLPSNVAKRHAALKGKRIR